MLQREWLGLWHGAGSQNTSDGDVWFGIALVFPPGRQLCSFLVRKLKKLLQPQPAQGPVPCASSEAQTSHFPGVLRSGFSMISWDI